jgi:asparagine synthase (glutamine-hydrolysing)
MQTALSHRGPDDRGIYLTPDEKLAFTHTRLSILDLSSAGHQPMSLDDGRYWITFNGEIYNFLELRHQLEKQGENFYSHTDTEVILRLYRLKGKDCLKDLQGMFAFALWDNLEKTCLIARDPLGIKPLYYAQLNNQLIFASELKAILASQLLEKNLNPLALYHYFRNGTVPEPLTLIEGVAQLQAGNYLEWNQGKVTQTTYWQPDFTPDLTITELEAQAIARQGLINSVEHHFLSDVPVGIFLSGGIDSTAILALARQTQSGQLKTYSLAFEDPRFNEGQIAQRTAQHFETEHYEQIVTASLGKSLFEQYLNSLDQPSIDGFNTFTVSKLAAEHQTKVVLSGLGGDELFAGYASFKTIPKLMQYRQNLQFLDCLTKFAGSYLSQARINPKFKRLGDFLQDSPTALSDYSVS